MDTCPVLRQRGQMLLLMAFLLIALLGMIGVAVDLGFGYEHRREAQNAADSAAMAGALALGRHIQYDKLSAAERLQLNLRYLLTCPERGWGVQTEGPSVARAPRAV
jgi:uncharacterized membrane protein